MADNALCLSLNRPGQGGLFEAKERVGVGEVAAFDVLSQAGLNGCLKSAAPEAPTDLATNSDQMEGFGGE